MPDDKRDSAPYADIYSHFLDAIELLPKDREMLKQKRGFTDEIINKHRFRSAGPHLESILTTIGSQFDIIRTKEAGLTDGVGPSPKLLKDNIIIPYFNSEGRVIYIRPHKDALHGLRMPIYCPGALQSFTILTESEFKAAACWQWGLTAVGLAGISAASGKNYPALLEVLKSHSVTSVCVIFDNETKDNPEYPNYKQHYWDRWDTQHYAYLMALKLSEDGLETSIGVLPSEWMQGGKIDLDGALAQGKSRQDIAIEVLRKRYRVGEYLKSLPRDVMGLIERKMLKSRLTTGITEGNRRYWVNRTAKDGTVAPQPISNFTMSIENNIFDAQGICTREMNFTNNVRDEAKRVVFKGEDFNHPVNFKKRCYQMGDYQFTGTAKDLENLMAYESARELGKRVYQPDHVGWVKEAGLYLFANAGLNTAGQRLRCDSDGIAWRGLTGYQAIQFHQGTTDREGPGDIPTLAEQDMDPEWLISTMQQNYSDDPAIRLACSWVIASFFSHYLSKVFGDVFPLLFVTGQLQSGKTTLCEWLCGMAGLRTRGYSFSVGTEVGLERGSFYYSSLPFWLDEYRNSEKNKGKESFFRSAYDRQMGLKGLRQGFGVRGGAIRACILVSGQDTPLDLALQQRFITIRLKRKRSGGQFSELQSRILEFSGIWPGLVAKFHRCYPEIVAAIRKMRDHLHNRGVDDRTVTFAIPMGVYDVLVRADDREFFDFVVNHALTSFGEKEKEKPTTQFLEGLQELKDTIFGTSVRSSKGLLAIYFTGAYGAYQKLLRQRGGEIGFKKETVLAEFSELDCFVEKTRSIRMAGQNVRCLMLDPKKDELVKDLYEAAEAE